MSNFQPRTNANIEDLLQFALRLLLSNSLLPSHWTAQPKRLKLCIRRRERGRNRHFAVKQQRIALRENKCGGKNNQHTTNAGKQKYSRKIRHIPSHLFNLIIKKKIHIRSRCKFAEIGKWWVKRVDGWLCFRSQFDQKQGGLIKSSSSCSSQSRKYRFLTFARVSKVTRCWSLSSGKISFLTSNFQVSEGIIKSKGILGGIKIRGYG